MHPHMFLLTFTCTHTTDAVWEFFSGRTGDWMELRWIQGSNAHSMIPKLAKERRHWEVYAKQIKEICVFTRLEIQPEGLNMGHFSALCFIQM